MQLFFSVAIKASGNDDVSLMHKIVEIGAD